MVSLALRASTEASQPFLFSRTPIRNPCSMNSGTSNARVEQLHARISELDSKIASQAATIAQQKQIGILTTELKDQPAEIQKVSARVEMNKSTKKWFSIIIRAGVDTVVAEVGDRGYSCNIKLGTKIEKTSTQRACYNNAKHMVDLEPRSTISATTVSRLPRRARRSRPTFRGQP
jgi:hypothetical protein